MTDTKKTSFGRVESIIGRARFQTIVTSGKHAIVVDEPEELHGSDTGMNPFGLLLSSLGSCTSITLRMYIDHKMWIVESISCELEIFKIDEGYLIENTLTFIGELTKEQISRLLEIADACPIHKILAGNIMINTQVSNQ